MAAARARHPINRRPRQEPLLRTHLDSLGLGHGGHGGLGGFHFVRRGAGENTGVLGEGEGVKGCGMEEDGRDGEVFIPQAKGRGLRPPASINTCREVIGAVLLISSPVCARSDCERLGTM